MASQQCRSTYLEVGEKLLPKTAVVQTELGQYLANTITMIDQMCKSLEDKRYRIKDSKNGFVCPPVSGNSLKYQRL